jgi:hypothetical protein
MGEEGRGRRRSSIYFQPASDGLLRGGGATARRLEAAARRPDSWRRRRGAGVRVWRRVERNRFWTVRLRRLPEAAGIGRQGGTLARFSYSHEARVGKREERGERLG